MCGDSDERIEWAVLCVSCVVRVGSEVGDFFCSSAFWGGWMFQRQVSVLWSECFARWMSMRVFNVWKIIVGLVYLDLKLHSIQPAIFQEATVAVLY